MRAIEFILESASSGATGSGNVASLAKPLSAKKQKDSFFGGDIDDYPGYGDTSMAVIRRNNKPKKMD